MSNDSAAARTLIIYAICAPLAIFLGYLISDPLDKTTDIVFGVVFFLLILPLMLRWYHAWLITLWNTYITMMFLPGLLPGWMPMACIALAIAVGHYILNRERKFLKAPSVAWSLVTLGLVVAITAEFRGGFGLRAMGDESIGGKRYLWIWVAIVGYFALVSQRIPLEKRNRYTTLFLLSSLTALVSQIAGFFGPVFNFLYIFFPSGSSAASMQGPMAEASLERYGGLSIAAVAATYTLVARYGIDGVLNLRKFWRPVLFLALLFFCVFGGYRSTFISVALTLFLVFCFEGSLRTHLMPIAVLAMIVIGSVTVGFSDRMPLPIQRCLAIFPLKIDPVARMSAEASTEWRLEIWRSLLPQIPHYLLLGKGLTFDANNLDEYRTLGNQQAMGEIGGGFALTGDYHSGPLTLIIPFGLWGCLAFFWFLVASVKVLWANYKFGDPAIRRPNTLLLSLFISKMIVFFVIFGGFHADLMNFVGIIGFNIALNGGVAKPVPVVRPQLISRRFRPLPAAMPSA
jgi:O-Antigen ligase